MAVTQRQHHKTEVKNLIPSLKMMNVLFLRHKIGFRIARTFFTIFHPLSNVDLMQPI